MGKIFGGIVGQSEENIRGALKVAEAIAPCILWIDEIEKGLSGSQSSSQTDGGTIGDLRENYYLDQTGTRRSKIDFSLFDKTNSDKYVIITATIKVNGSIINH